MRFRFLSAGMVVLAVLPAGHAATPSKVDFNRDIRPILSENCFQCHGQDEARREARLRLDERESAVRARDGIAAIVPGNPGESELMRRVLSADSTEVMPPPETHKRVSLEQAALLREWIATGAEYQRHWSFLPPARPGLPAVAGVQWSRNAIDRFVLARLEAAGLGPSPAATPSGWLRRVTLDLIGLPPTLTEQDDFAAEVAARGEPAYAAAVDRLMASRHYGERQAMEWLDAARYADTHGFNNDSARSMWRWRDWVIDAFNTNLPYDQFITHQLAGDLLPQPTLDQRIATGFGRNHVINSEGGIIAEEYRVEYVADRVRTVSTAWLGLTMECARCHDHKFDPIKQSDYFQLFAFFNNVPEYGEDGRVANAVPMMPAPTKTQQAELAALRTELEFVERELRPLETQWRWDPSHAPRVEQRYGEATALVKTLGGADLLKTDAGAAKKKKSPPTSDPEKTAGAETTPAAADGLKIPAAKLDFSSKQGITVALWMRAAADNPPDVALLSAMNHTGNPADAGYGKGREWRLINGELEFRLNDRFPVYAVVVRTSGARLAPELSHHVALVYGGGRKASDVRFFVNGTEVGTVVVHDNLFGDPAKRDFLVGTDNGKDAAKFRGELNHLRGFPRALSPDEIRAVFQSEALARALSTPAAPGTTELQWLRETELREDPSARALLSQRDRIRHDLFALQRSLPTVMVMEERAQPRPAHVLIRGQYDAPGERVEPGVPESLLGSWPAQAPRNRLGLAQWLIKPDHPLTGRVVVNRFWTQFFGTGLVKTLEDFGSQSEWPSHPALLDWLAREFVDGGWDVKALLRTIVLSSTYRQSSVLPGNLAARDPENRLLARGPRVRLPAELIRDQALAVSGLLSREIGGPSVFPYQPEKLYEGIVVGAAYPGTQWVPSKGADLHRRSLYTFWKRTMPHPVMTTFDAPDREFCTVRRSRTNTPLQALTLLNEPGYLEAARQLGTRTLKEGGADDLTRVNFAFRAVTGRAPRPEETRVLATAWARMRADFIAHGADAYAFANVGASPLDATLPPAELAAAMAVASMILNLDEAVTKN